MRHRTGTLYRRGRIWWLKYMVDGRLLTQSLDTPSKPDAEKRRREVMRPMIAAAKRDVLAVQVDKLQDVEAECVRIADEQRKPVRIEGAFDDYQHCQNRPDSGPATMRQYQAEHRRFARWIAGKHPRIVDVRDVTRGIAEEYAAHLHGCGVSPGTFNQHIGFLHLLWRTLREKAGLTGNPWEGIKRKALMQRGQRRELTTEELCRVCQSADGELRLLFALGIYTGLRLGDCVTLDWGEVDVKQGIIRRIPMKTARRGAKPVRIPIHPILSGLLQELPREARKGPVLPKMADQYRRESSSVTRVVQAHFAANQIETARQGTGGATGQRAVVEVGFHSLRHTFVSLCREGGVPLAVVEGLVGHSSPAMTRHYTHISELAAARAIAALPSVMDASKNPPVQEFKQLDAATVRRTAETMTARNWKAKREELLDLCRSAGWQ